MKPQIQPNYFSCFITSFAIVLDTFPKTLMEEIGHDGSEIIFPSEQEPYGRRAFHPQELIAPCLRRGYAMVLVEALPVYSPPSTAEDFHPLIFDCGNDIRLRELMNGNIGVLTGENASGNPHAIAWDGQKYYNTDGTIHETMDFSIREFFMLCKIKAA